MPIDGIYHNLTISGVPIMLTAIDPNGNAVTIGNVTTDGYTGAYGFTWNPDKVGQYQITATFEGDDSYGSSFATTYVSVGTAATTAPTPQTTVETVAVTPTDLMTYIVIAIIAIIIAIAIATVLIIRKH